MSASIGEVQEHADRILELLGYRIRSGQMVIHFDEYRVQSVDTNMKHRPKRLESLRQPQNPLDSGHG